MIAEKRIACVGKSPDPSDTEKPFYIGIDWALGEDQTMQTVVQPVSADELIILFNRVIEKHKPTVAVTVKDDG